MALEIASSTRENLVQTSAEGATALVNSQATRTDVDHKTLESGAEAPAEGIAISGTRTEGASVAQTARCGAVFSKTGVLIGDLDVRPETNGIFRSSHGTWR